MATNIQEAGSLSEAALHSLRAYFATAGHSPSDAHWNALAAIADTMEAMANGTCPPQVFLSAVDPGVGKSQTVLHFARALLAAPDHRSVGMVVCVGRITEAVALAGLLASHREHVAVVTNNDAANALGGAMPHDAQVLITTQQRIERATEGRAFETIEAFHYRGAPRAVRVWDEAWLPGVAVTIDSDDLFGLLKPARRVSPDLADGVKAFADKLADVSDGEAVAVPDFATAYEGALYNLAASLSEAGTRWDDQKRTSTGLVMMSGKVARVRREGGRSGGTMLTYRDTLPDDLLPLLVLDASGRVRQTYAYMEEHRKNITRLPEAAKHYDPLTVYLWKTSGSKSGFASNGQALVKGIADTIATRPEERWLIVVHKAGGKVTNVEAAIRRMLPTVDRANIGVITWGNHMATNDFIDVPNVILAGTLFMKPSFYAALTHLAQDRAVAPGLASGEEISRTMRGEHANLILQALCRGRVRRSDGDRCHPMNAYIIASAQSGIHSEVGSIFPGCTIKPWTTTEAKPFKGRLRDLAGIVMRRLKSGETEMTNQSLYEEMTMAKQNFGALVKKTEWKAYVTQAGLKPQRLKGQIMGLRRVA